MPRKKKQEKIDKVIELLEEILKELKKLNENTNNGKCEEEWEKIVPFPTRKFPDGTPWQRDDTFWGDLEGNKWSTASWKADSYWYFRVLF